MRRVFAVVVVVLGAFLGYALGAGYIAVLSVPTPLNVVVAAVVFGAAILAAMRLWR